MELIHRATKLAPSRYDLAWLEFQLCETDQSCDSKPIVARLQALDPRNAVSWIGELPTRDASVDDPRFDVAIQKMADSDRFDIKWVPTILHVTTAINRTKTLDTASAVVASVGIAAAWAIPAYADVSRACKGEALRLPDRLEACKRLASVMRDGDTYVTELVGIAIAKRVWPETSDSYADAARAARQAHYRMAIGIEASAKHEWDDAYARKYLGWLTSSKTEQEVSRAELLDAGLDPDPPPDWKEPSTHADSPKSAALPLYVGQASYEIDGRSFETAAELEAYLRVLKPSEVRVMPSAHAQYDRVRGALEAIQRVGGIGIGLVGNARF
jgi:hypothetical protein